MEDDPGDLPEGAGPGSSFLDFLPQGIDEALAEGIRIEFLAAPIAVELEDGEFTGITCQRMELGEPDASGRRRPVPVEGSEELIDVDNIFSAIGQSPVLSRLMSPST